MATQKRKWRHHYVPEMLLKNFADDKGLLHVIDRVRNVRRPATIPRQLGFGRDYYYLAHHEDGNSVEDAFAELEAIAAPLIAKITQTRTLPKNTDDWRTLIRFVAIQAARVPATKQMISRPIQREHEIVADLLRHEPRAWKNSAHLLGIDSSKITYDEFLELTDEDVIQPLSNHDFIQYSMSIAKPIMESINQRLWTVVHSDKPGEHFIISDDPVVLYWSDGVQRRLPPGYVHRNTDVTMPLSSEVALVLTHQDFRAPEGGTRHQVARINSKTIAGSHHFVAARNEAFICYMPEGIAELTDITARPAIPPLIM